MNLLCRSAVQRYHLQFVWNKAEIVDTDMPGIIKTLFANSIKNELLKELRKPITARIVSVTEEKLVLLDPDEKDPANQLSEYTRTK